MGRSAGCFAGPLGLGLAHHLLGFYALGSGDVLEQFFDQVHVCEDHAAAAVAPEVQLVDGVTGVYMG